MNTNTKKTVIALSVAAALIASASAADASVVLSAAAFTENATIAAGGAQNQYQSAGGFVQTHNVSGLTLGVSYSPHKSPLVVGLTASGDHGIVSTSTLVADAGWSVVALPRLLVTPRVEIGHTHVSLSAGGHYSGGAPSDFVGAGVDAAYHVSPRLTLNLGGSVGRSYLGSPFHSTAGGGQYDTANVGVAVAAGPGAIEVSYRYAYLPVPTTNAIALTTRRWEMGYVLPF